MVITTWLCDFCGWLNDNNPGPCRKCGGRKKVTDHADPSTNQKRRIKST
jgi:hypothetical protein